MKQKRTTTYRSYLWYVWCCYPIRILWQQSEWILLDAASPILQLSCWVPAEARPQFSSIHFLGSVRAFSLALWCFMLKLQRAQGSRDDHEHERTEKFAYCGVHWFIAGAAGGLGETFHFGPRSVEFSCFRSHTHPFTSHAQENRNRGRRHGAREDSSEQSAHRKKTMGDDGG